MTSAPRRLQCGRRGRAAEDLPRNYLTLTKPPHRVARSRLNRALERSGQGLEALGTSFMATLVFSPPITQGRRSLVSSGICRESADTIRRRGRIGKTQADSEQEGSAYSGRFESVCYHPLLLFNQHGDFRGREAATGTCTAPRTGTSCFCRRSNLIRADEARLQLSVLAHKPGIPIGGGEGCRGGSTADRGPACGSG